MVCGADPEDRRETRIVSQVLSADAKRDIAARVLRSQRETRIASQVLSAGAKRDTAARVLKISAK